MNLNDLEILKPDDLGFYNLNIETWEIPEGTQFGRYEVQKGEEMRIDLISESIFGDSDNSDIILNVNLISNPLNIKEGDILIYPLNNIDIIRKVTEGLEEYKEIRQVKNRKDKGKEDKSEWDKSGLPPTILNKPTRQFEFTNDSIVLGTNLI